MKPLRYPETKATAEQLRPLGDLVLVRPLKLEAETHSGRLVIPESARMPERGLRRGMVVACGPGDRAIGFMCADCRKFYTSTITMEGDLQSSASKVSWHVADCPYCSSSNREILHTGIDGHRYEERRPMHVKPGDTVIYPRVPANGLRLGDEDFVLLHEEQHVLAVIE